MIVVWKRVCRFISLVPWAMIIEMNNAFESVRQLLETRAAECADNDCLLSEADELILNYREFDFSVNRTANLLMSQGIRKGDRVSLFLTNRLEYLLFYFACFKLGAWAGPINALLKPPETRFVLENSEAAVAVTEPTLLPTLAEASAPVTTLREIILVGETRGTADQYVSKPVIDYAREVFDQPERLEPVALSPSDEAVIIYTSGTTGKPKGVLLTHGNLLANAREIAEWLRLTREDRSLIIMPLFHVNALMTTGLAVLWAGGSSVLAPRFSASRHWERIARNGVTYFGSVATMLALLNNTYPGGVPAGLDVGSLRFALCGSAPVPLEIMRRYEDLFHCPVVEGYGLTECTCRATFNPIDGERRPGSIGLPISNEMKILDEGDRETEKGKVGEIAIRGANVMKGYYKNDDATREALRSGWLHTGDLGYRDEDGFFFIVDRKSDMIIRGGENIYPREIDEVLYKHPKVKDAATVGIPDAIYGEGVTSFVVLREGLAATQEEILAFCRSRLADFKCPQSVEFVADIPKGPTGKLLKRELVGRHR